MVPPTLPKVGQLSLQCVLKKLKPGTDDGEQPDISDDEGLLSEGGGGEGRREQILRMPRRAEEGSHYTHMHSPTHALPPTHLHIPP